GNRLDVHTMVQDASHPLDNGQTETKSTKLSVSWRLVVLIKYPRQMLSHDANAAVPHLDRRMVSTTPASHNDFALFRVAQRVGQQVSDHLVQHAPVAASPKARGDHAKLQAFFDDRFGEVGGDTFKQLIDREFADRGLQDTGFEPVDVKQSCQHSV